MYIFAYRAWVACLAAGILASIILCGAERLVAQSPKSLIDYKARAAYNELDGYVTLFFIDAVTEKPIAGADVAIDSVGAFSTDESGEVLFEPPPDGIYTVRFAREGYMESEFPIEVIARSLFFNIYPISRQIELGQLRVVVMWSGSPQDLDAHLEKRGEYHISYRNMRAAADGSAELDRDDVDGYGPETITVKKVAGDGAYTFYVEDFTNRNSARSNALCRSKAVVSVFGEGKLLKQFAVPRDGAGVRWDVFAIERGAIIPMNSLLSQ